jgi:hypothetical protein
MRGEIALLIDRARTDLPAVVAALAEGASELVELM